MFSPLISVHESTKSTTLVTTLGENVLIGIVFSAFVKFFTLRYTFCLFYKTCTARYIALRDRFRSFFLPHEFHSVTDLFFFLEELKIIISIFPPSAAPVTKSETGNWFQFTK